MASPASHDVRVVKRSALAGVAGVGRRHTRQPRRHVSPRRRRARRPVLPRSINNLYLTLYPLARNELALKGAAMKRGRGSASSAAKPAAARSAAKPAAARPAVVQFYSKLGH